MTQVALGRETTGDWDVVQSREWLVTNGIGGFASGTVAGTLSRRYHGLLVAALKPPLGRTLLVSKLDETATYDDRCYPLFANLWAGGTVEPAGYVHIDSFRLGGGVPLWRFALADALLEKRIWMEQGANTTYVFYRLSRATKPLSLEIKAIINFREFHGLTHCGDVQIEVKTIEGGLMVEPATAAAPFFILGDKGQVTEAHEWYENFELPVEQYRGLGHVEDHLYAGSFNLILQPGESATIVASTAREPDLAGERALARRRQHERRLLEGTNSLKGAPEWIPNLILAADQFIVDRPLPNGNNGKTVIAGYHWFGDWGRDTMIGLPGLALSTGRPGVARSILQTYGAYVDQGMLPNRFPDRGEPPEYNTVDATLWYFEAIRAYHASTQDDELLRDLYSVLDDIISWHLKGTRYRIRVDPQDGLLFAGQQGVQLTWMDAKVDDWVVTPRIGKPVEVNALWYNALRLMGQFARTLGKAADFYDDAAERARHGFGRFWNGQAGYCFDVIDGPDGPDPSCRPNQILAVSLGESPLTSEQQRLVVEACGRHLFTPHGLRSLAPGEPGYEGHYGGDRRQRDGAYHQGTVWGWLLGPFCEAHLRVYEDPALSMTFLEPMVSQLSAAGLGSLSEIFDGDAPHAPRGCIAQAWTVAEVLRAWQKIDQARRTSFK